MTDAIRVSRLPSGLTVVTETMDRVETVSLGAYVAAGTRNETEAENGASHVLEHMAVRRVVRPQPNPGLEVTDPPHERPQGS